MAKLYFQGKLRYRIRSYIALAGFSVFVVLRRLVGAPLNPEWPILFEIGVYFWRHQFNAAFAAKNIQDGRAYFDSLITTTGDTYPVNSFASRPNEPAGAWHVIKGTKPAVTLLYCHGGGYTFHSDNSSIFAQTLAGLLDAKLFMPTYRLTPEHTHPAQLEDALCAYRFILKTGVDPSELVVIGDSAGGHLMLMLLQALREENLPRPALSIGLCPWTDIGDRGESLFKNDKYDLVQGYMALKFGEWLQGDSGYTREDLSPIDQDFHDLGPIYLQAGGREILVDMIRDFANVIKAQGTEVALDVWPEMTHNFQMHGRTHPDSKEAFDRMKEIIKIKLHGNAGMPSCHRTEVIQ